MLKLNPVKSNIILFGNKYIVEQIKLNFNITLDGQPLLIVDHAKSLGLILDSQLRFSDHVSYMPEKTYIAIKLLYPHRQYLDINIKKELCESLVLSHFNHYDYVYGPCLSSYDRYRIQKVQNYCIRFFFGIRRREYPISLGSCHG